MKKIMPGQNSRVLFQKLGNIWYVFAESKGEIVYSKLDENIDPEATPLELFEVLEEGLPCPVLSKEILT